MAPINPIVAGLLFLRSGDYILVAMQVTLLYIYRNAKNPFGSLLVSDFKNMFYSEFLRQFFDHIHYNREDTLSPSTYVLILCPIYL